MKSLVIIGDFPANIRIARLQNRILESYRYNSLLSSTHVHHKICGLHFVLVAYRLYY
jgi:hypothetical protein